MSALASRVFEQLRAAIRQRTAVSLLYAGHRREVCPHVLGYKDRRAHVLVFQFAGGSSHPLPPGGAWKCLALSGIAGVEPREGAWHSAQNYGPAQSCVDEVVAAIDA